MPSNASLVLADGQGTPANHTFVPAPLGPNAMSWVDKSGAFPAAYNRVTATFKAPQNGSKMYRETLKVEVPTGSITNGIATVDNVAVAIVEFTLPETGTLQSRKDLKAYLKNALANSVNSDVIEGPEFVY